MEQWKRTNLALIGSGGVTLGTILFVVLTLLGTRPSIMAIVGALLALAGAAGTAARHWWFNVPDGPVTQRPWFYPSARWEGDSIAWTASRGDGLLFRWSVVALLAGVIAMAYTHTVAAQAISLRYVLLFAVCVFGIVAMLLKPVGVPVHIGPNGVQTRDWRGDVNLHGEGVTVVGPEAKGGLTRVGLYISDGNPSSGERYIEVPPFRNASRNEVIRWLTNPRQAPKPLLN